METVVRDSLNRRPRDRRNPTGKHLTLTERDLLWFQKIQLHGPLSSSFLRAYSQFIRKNDTRASERLTDLFNENNTPHRGPYLDRPWQQFDTLNAHCNDLVYDITEFADEALRSAGRVGGISEHPTGPWKHRYTVSSITAAIELEILKHPTLRFIPQHEILARAGASLGAIVPFTYRSPETGQTAQESRTLVPDALFGIEYAQPEAKRAYRFFLLEADRKTEPTRASRFDRKSYLRTILQYREFIGQGLYKAHYKLESSALLLNVMTSPLHMRSVMSLVAEISGGRNSYMLFKCLPQFGTYFKPAKPDLALLSTPWERVGYEPFDISQP